MLEMSPADAHSSSVRQAAEHGRNAAEQARIDAEAIRRGAVSEGLIRIRVVTTAAWPRVRTRRSLPGACPPVVQLR